MHRIALLVPGLVALVVVVVSAAAESTPPSQEETEPCRHIEVFHRTGCPHCGQAFQFLDQLQRNHPTITVQALEVNESPQVRRRFIELNRKFAVNRPGVPTFLICDNLMVGFQSEETTGVEIKRLLGLEPVTLHEPETGSIETGWFGALSAEGLGLPLFTVAIGLIDGFNPCAMWVLLFLLSLLVNLRDRRRIIVIAGTFVFVSGAVYFAFMAAWLNVFLIVGFSRALQVAVGLIAVLIGVVHVKDFFSFNQGVSLSIPDAAKPGLYARTRRVIQAENMLGALVGVTVVAMLVNLVELLCTAGLPAVYTQILASRSLSAAQYYLYLLLYNLAYIIDDALMVGIVVYTLSRHKLKESTGRWLKLLSGSVILVLGTLLLLAPRLL
jgi:hypothetical protein